MKTEKALSALRQLGADLNRGACIPNLAEQIWDECDAITVALRAAADAIPPSQPKAPAEAWRPIAEAPKDGTDILVYLPSDDLEPEEVAMVRWDGDGWEFERGGWLSEEAPTHWRPLPPAPAERTDQ